MPNSLIGLFLVLWRRSLPSPLGPAVAAIAAASVALSRPRRDFEVSQFLVVGHAGPKNTLRITKASMVLARMCGHRVQLSLAARSDLEFPNRPHFLTETHELSSKHWRPVFLVFSNGRLEPLLWSETPMSSVLGLANM